MQDVKLDGVTTAKALEDLMKVSDYTWGRTRGRCDGLSDEEYLWEPAPGCWSVRAARDGTHRVDGAVPQPDPAPLTTIAWRLCHLIECYGADRNATWIGLEPVGTTINPMSGTAPSTASAAIAMLDRAHERWRTHVTALAEEALWEPIGPIGEQYAEETKAGFILHMLDEFIHHAAEIGVLRDLYRAHHPVTCGDALVDALLLGEKDAVASLQENGEVLERLQRERPELVAQAAVLGRWNVVTALVEMGFALDARGRSALHIAAGMGYLDVVQLLVERGADTAAKDPEWSATPLVWAEYLSQSKVAEYLASR